MRRSREVSEANGDTGNNPGQESFECLVPASEPQQEDYSGENRSVNEIY